MAPPFPPRVGWLYLDDAEIERARELEQQCNQDSLDEMGFGTLSLAYSERFFPGTNTLMTHARYVLFVAWIYRHMEQAYRSRKTRRTDVETWARELQDRVKDGLIQHYWKVSKGRYGIHGAFTDDLERYPSYIYWGALVKLGILESPRSRTAFQRALPSVTAPTRGDDHQPTVELEDTMPTWNRGLPEPVGAFEAVLDPKRPVEELDFGLTRQESRFLHDCYLRDEPGSPGTGTGQSLLACLLRYRHSSGFSFPWDEGIAQASSHGQVPPDLVELIEQARVMSLLGRAAVLAYHHEVGLARQAAGLPSPGLHRVPAFARGWWEAGRDDLCASWDPARFRAAAVAVGGLARGPDDMEFFEALVRIVLDSPSPSAWLVHRDLGPLIRHRERLCKPGRPRLDGTRTRLASRLENPPGREADQYQHDCRGGIGSEFATKIIAGLAETEAA